MDAAAREAPGELEVADVDSFCLEGEVEGACLVRYGEEEDQAGTLLAAVARCNTYDAADYVPVRVGAEQVGWANGALLAALAAQIKLGRTCALEAREVRGLPIVTLVGGLAHEGTMVEGVPTLGLQLAPDATSVAEATRLVAALVDGLVEDGFIPAAKIRQELQDVWPLARGFVGVGGGAPLLAPELQLHLHTAHCTLHTAHCTLHTAHCTLHTAHCTLHAHHTAARTMHVCTDEPLLGLERAAMIYLGIPSYGVHVNGWVANPEDSEDLAPWVEDLPLQPCTRATTLCITCCNRVCASQAATLVCISGRNLRCTGLRPEMHRVAA